MGCVRPFLLTEEPPMSVLRQRMIEDMQLRNLALNTQISYIQPQPSPHFSDDRECLNERPVLIQIFAKSRDEWAQTGLRHVWDQLIKHAALPEQ
jgi:hypothetical protein